MVDSQRHHFQASGEIGASTSLEFAHEDLRQHFRSQLGDELADMVEAQAPEMLSDADSIERVVASNPDLWTWFAALHQIEESSYQAWRLRHPKKPLPFDKARFVESHHETQQRRYRKLQKRLHEEIRLLRQWFAHVMPKRLGQPDTLPINPLHGEADAVLQAWSRKLDIFDATEALSGTVEHALTVAANIAA